MPNMKENLESLAKTYLVSSGIFSTSILNVSMFLHPPLPSLKKRMEKELQKGEKKLSLK